MNRYNCVDAIVKGEAEQSVLVLLKHFEGDSQLSAANPFNAGILVRNGSGQVQHLYEHQLVSNLDDLPIPAYDAYTPDPGEEIFMEVGRGCPFSCEFCSTAPFWNRKHRVKSPERILQEIALLRKLFSADRLHFTHDLFTTDRAWVGRVCEALLREKVPVTWTCSARTDTVDAELLRLMKSAGCRAIYFGIESGSQRILKEIRKDIPIAHSLSIVKECAAIGIVPNVGFILGFPTEDESSIRDTFNIYAETVRLGARPAHLFGYCPFAQSSMAKSMARFRHDGHYVDIPLGSTMDLANRELIGSSPELYGSYYRIVSEPDVEDIMEGIDEFSPLVEATRVPTLLAADLMFGGMYELYRKWVTFIREKNRVGLKPKWRQSYGSAIEYVTFLREYVGANKSAPDYLAELLRATEIGLRVARIPEPTSMDSYRSFSNKVNCTDIGADDVIKRGGIEALDKYSHDISDLLSDSPSIDLSAIERGPVYLVWQRHLGRIRILKVSPYVYNVLTVLDQGEASVSDLFMLDPSLDESENLNQLVLASAKDLVRIAKSTHEAV
jgi:hypothetical protein